MAKAFDDDEMDTLSIAEAIHARPGNPKATVINESGLVRATLQRAVDGALLELAEGARKALAAGWAE